MEGQRCAECRFYAMPVDGWDKGQCRKKAPGAYGLEATDYTSTFCQPSLFPRMPLDGWCGEWAPAPEKSVHLQGGTETGYGAACGMGCWEDRNLVVREVTCNHTKVTCPECRAIMGAK